MRACLAKLRGWHESRYNDLSRVVVNDTSPLTPCRGRNTLGVTWYGHMSPCVSPAWWRPIKSLLFLGWYQWTKADTGISMHDLFYSGCRGRKDCMCESQNIVCTVYVYSLQNLHDVKFETVLIDFKKYEANNNLLLLPLSVQLKFTLGAWP